MPLTPCCHVCVQEMDKIVGEGEHVQVIHPGASTIAGREQVGCARGRGGSVERGA